MGWAVVDAGRLVKRLARVRPLERVGHRAVVVVEEAAEFLFQVVEGGEVPPTNHLPHDDSEHRLHLVQPGTVLGQIHEADAM